MDSMRIVYFNHSIIVSLEKAKLGIQLGEGGRIGGMLFADDFVGLSDSKEQLEKLIDVVYNKWRLKANVTKSAVMGLGMAYKEGARLW